MGLKKRDFTGTLRGAVLAAIEKSNGMTRRELLEVLRRRRDLNVSVRRVGAALSRLVKSGRVVQSGSRAGAKFRIAEA